MSVTEQTAAFDATDYEIPLNRPPAPDPHQVLIKLRGSLKLNRNDPAHMHLVAKLELGRAIPLNIVATTTSSGDAYRIDDQGQVTVTYIVSLNADMIEIAE